MIIEIKIETENRKQNLPFCTVLMNILPLVYKVK